MEAPCVGLLCSSILRILAIHAQLVSSEAIGYFATIVYASRRRRHQTSTMQTTLRHHICSNNPHSICMQYGLLI